MMAINIRKLGGYASAAVLAMLVSGCAARKPDSVPCTILQQTSRCAAVSVHDDVHEGEAKLLTPAPDGFGYVYIARPYAQQRSVRAKVYVDEVFVAELGPKSFSRLKVRPGRHTIKLSAANVEEVSTSVEVKRDAYLEYQIAEYFFSTVPEIKLVSRERAKDLLQPLDMVVSWEE
jgi:hypothetical protein